MNNRKHKIPPTSRFWHSNNKTIIFPFCIHKQIKFLTETIDLFINWRPRRLTFARISVELRGIGMNVNELINSLFNKNLKQRIIPLSFDLANTISLLSYNNNYSFWFDARFLLEEVSLPLEHNPWNSCWEETVVEAWSQNLNHLKIDHC